MDIYYCIDYNGNMSAQNKESTELPAIILHNFSNEELALIVDMVKANMPHREIIFAKSTPTSLGMKLADLIADITEDHTYLKENPPHK